MSALSGSWSAGPDDEVVLDGEATEAELEVKDTEEKNVCMELLTNEDRLSIWHVPSIVIRPAAYATAQTAVT